MRSILGGFPLPLSSPLIIAIEEVGPLDDQSPAGDLGRGSVPVTGQDFVVRRPAEPQQAQGQLDQRITVDDLITRLIQEQSVEPAKVL